MMACRRRNRSLWSRLSFPTLRLTEPRPEEAVQRTVLRMTAVASQTALSCFAAALVLLGASNPRPAEYTFEVVHAFPHDRMAFTQGLEFHAGFLYESTGLNGRSSLRKVRLETGEVVQQVDVPPEFFGEGITLLHDEIYQLTWQSQVGFVYNARDFRLLRRFSYTGEGWGLTNNGREIFMSDGSSELRVIEPGTFTEKRRIKVHDGAHPIEQLNELEWVEGEIFANIWQTDRIARISPATGDVVGWIDLAGLLSPVYKVEPGAVLNGIAYDVAQKRLFVTGKLWPNLFEIRVVRKHGK